MRKINFLARTLAIMVMILFASVFGLSHSGQGTTIYVDDDNTSGPWDGTMEYPYQFIQEAIDSASPGNTVYVYSGTYYENIIIDKTLSLLGEDPYNTIIDGGGIDNVINVDGSYTVDASNVIIANFTIRHGGSGWLYANKAGIFVSEWAHSARLLNNIIKDNHLNGISILSSYNTISGNIITNGGFAGIHLRWTSNTIVSKNIISNAGVLGIVLDESYFDEVFDNIIKDNACGIVIDGEYGIADNNIIHHNNFLYNTDDNAINTRPEVNNLWYDTTFQQGNYWSDYTGVDADSNGVGDTPYDISGGVDQDPYPLMSAVSFSGDVDDNGDVTIADAVYLIHYLFLDGPIPYPIWAGDLNCDGAISVIDVVYLLNYLFKSGPPPCQ